MNAATPQAPGHPTSGCQNHKAEKSSERPLDANVEAVVQRLCKRALVGLNKYGVTTERTDLTTLEWLNHAQEEAMDLAVYLERCIKDLKVMQKRGIPIRKWLVVSTTSGSGFEIDAQFALVGKTEYSFVTDGMTVATFPTKGTVISEKREQK